MSGLLLIGAMGRELQGATTLIDLAVLRTGVGRTRTETSLAALRGETPGHVLHVGFAGALRAGLVEGDLMLVTEVIGAGQSKGPYPCAELDVLRSALALMPGRLAQGSLLTVPSFVDRPEDKRVLSERHHAAACDMEAHWVACMCAELGVPYSGLRAISDNSDRRLLPPLRRPDGQVAFRQFARGLASPATPWRAAVMLHGMRRAERSLCAALPVAVAALRRSCR